MSAPKRTDFEREAQLVEIKDAYLRGDTQMDIAARLGLSQSQISRDLSKIQRRWRESSLVDINEAKQRELERIDVLEREYWQAWEASRGEQQRSTAGKMGDVSRAQIVKFESAGDPRFLAGVQWCIEQRCKIIGLLAAVRNELTGKNGEPIQTQQVFNHDAAVAALARRPNKDSDAYGADENGGNGP